MKVPVEIEGSLSLPTRKFKMCLHTIQTYEEFVNLEKR